MRYFILFLTLILHHSAICHPTKENSENSRHVLDNKRINGKNVVTSVSVILNGNEPQFTDAIGQPIPKPMVPLQVASPINLLNPDRYEFYTFNDNGELIKRLMTLKEIQSIVANGDGDGGAVVHTIPINDRDPEKNVHDIVASVQHVLTKEVEWKKNKTNEQHVLDTPDVSSSWSMILPAIFGNTGGDIFPAKPQQAGMMPTTQVVESTSSRTTFKPKTTTTFAPLRTKPQKKKTTPKIITTTTTTAKPTHSTKSTTPATTTPVRTTTTKPTTIDAEIVKPLNINEKDVSVKPIFNRIESTSSKTNSVHSASNNNFNDSPTYVIIPMAASSSSLPQKIKIKTTTNNPTTINPTTELDTDESLSTQKPITSFHSTTNSYPTRIISKKPTTDFIQIPTLLPEYTSMSTDLAETTSFTTTDQSQSNNSEEKIEFDPLEMHTTEYDSSIKEILNSLATEQEDINTKLSFDQILESLKEGSQTETVATETESIRFTTIQPVMYSGGASILNSNRMTNLPEKYTQIHTEYATNETPAESELKQETTEKTKLEIHVNTSSVPSNTVKFEPVFVEIRDPIVSEIPVETPTTEIPEVTFTTEETAPILNVDAIDSEQAQVDGGQLKLSIVQEKHKDMTDTKSPLPVSTRPPLLTTRRHPTKAPILTTLPSSVVQSSLSPQTASIAVNHTSADIVQMIDKYIEENLGNSELMNSDEINYKGISTMPTINGGDMSMSDFREQAATVASIIEDNTNTKSEQKHSESASVASDEIESLLSDVINQMTDSPPTHVPLKIIADKDETSNRLSNIAKISEEILTPLFEQNKPIDESTVEFHQLETMALKTEDTSGMEHQSKENDPMLDAKPLISGNTLNASVSDDPPKENGNDKFSNEVTDAPDDIITTMILDKSEQNDTPSSKESVTITEQSTDATTTTFIPSTIQEESHTFDDGPSEVSEVTTMSSETEKETDKTNITTSNIVEYVPLEMITSTVTKELEDSVTEVGSTKEVVTETTTNIETEEPLMNVTHKDDQKTSSAMEITSTPMTTFATDTSSEGGDLATTTIASELMTTTLSSLGSDSIASTEINTEKLENSELEKATESENAYVKLGEMGLSSAQPEADNSKITTIKSVDNEESSTTMKNSEIETTKNPLASTLKPVHYYKQPSINDHKYIQFNPQRPMVRPPALSNLKVTQNLPTRPPVKLDPTPEQALGLEVSTINLEDDVQEFARLCNELAFNYWKSITSERISPARSLIISPFAITSMLSMVFLGARGSTSGEMNEILRLDDMVTFNPHLVFKNITDSVEHTKDSNIESTAFVREIFTDRSNGKVLQFFKEKTQQLYSGHVEEVNFNVVNDIIRRRTNLLIKRHTMGKIGEYLRTNSVWVNGPLATVAANVFQTDCSRGSTYDRDGEMFFQVHPSVRQRRLVPIPAIVFKSGFSAGYDPQLDATLVAFGAAYETVSTVYVMPGQQGTAAPGDSLERLEATLMSNGITRNVWSHMLTTLMDRPGLEVQLPRFSHRSFINASMGLQRMGLKALFNSDHADLRGLTGSSNRDVYLSDMIQINTFSTCGEEKISDQHHIEMYPAPPLRRRNAILEERLHEGIERRQEEEITIIHDNGRAFYDDLLDPKYLELPLPLRPRQARIPDAPRLRFDKPFLFFVRHNPTGMILFMGRFNPRLLP